MRWYPVLLVHIQPDKIEEMHWNARVHIYAVVHLASTFGAMVHEDAVFSTIVHLDALYSTVVHLNAI